MHSIWSDQTEADCMMSCDSICYGNSFNLQSIQLKPLFLVYSSTSSSRILKRRKFKINSFEIATTHYKGDHCYRNVTISFFNRLFRKEKNKVQIKDTYEEKAFE